jgi:hypothetical protein
MNAATAPPTVQHTMNRPERSEWVLSPRAPLSLTSGSPQNRSITVPLAADRVAPGHCAQLAQHWVAPTAGALEQTLVGDVLPVLAATRDRAGLAAWVAEEPNRVAVPMHRPTFARLFAQWGQTRQAARLLAHVDEHWPSLRENADTVAARGLLGEP